MKVGKLMSTNNRLMFPRFVVIYYMGYARFTEEVPIQAFFCQIYFRMCSWNQPTKKSILLLKTRGQNIFSSETEQSNHENGKFDPLLKMLNILSRHNLNFFRNVRWYYETNMIFCKGFLFSIPK
ncbi:hypothetical protein BpHYR1_044549 [Brachionus plicatilis]|uniref:Uncharacterized protein n=1 Tax=Brachionus plicatilis TaxID=10195 RepID=A0A3M7R157_BRAPC|nr:hypothetical protein BpHYR1_044549 [Brachionus plicatilis]